MFHLSPGHLAVWSRFFKKLKHNCQKHPPPPPPPIKTILAEIIIAVV